MSSITRREIARLTVLLAARRVVAATLTAAYVLRGVVRAVGAAARNLTAVAAETPGLSILLCKFLRP
ncbi:MAG: hypothetical protein EA426_20135 [Spirochaetaceae bacterium]|nr:MAG: hypothetical protein EA426_20135 [Spirochaetaceae bacterium]